MSLDKDFLKHCYIEFRYSKIPNPENTFFLNESRHKDRLWEEHGVMSQMDIYTNEVSQYIAKQLQGKENGVYKFIMTENDFTFPTFFDQIELTISITLNDTTPPKFSGGYTSGMSGWYSEGYRVKMSLDIEGTFDGIVDRIKVPFCHELTHAYDDYSRRRQRRRANGKYKQSGDSLFVNGNKTGQYIASEIDDEKGYQALIGNLLYYFNDTETNAYIAETREELPPLLVGKHGAKDVMEAIKQTRIYKRMLDIEEDFKIFDSIATGEAYEPMREKLLQTFNRTRMKKPYLRLMGITKDTPVDTYEKMLKILHNKFYRFKKRIITQVPKIAYDIYTQVGDPGTDLGKTL